MGDFVTDLTIESWVLWSIGVVLIACRFISRRMMLRSFKKLQTDDWIMLFTLLTFTGNVVAINQVAQSGSNYLPDGAAALLTPEEVASAVYGSKMTLVTEEFTLFTTWQIKACLLLLYHRLTVGLKQNVAVKILGAYCLLGFIVTQILYLAVWCRPISQYWAVPVTDSQCVSYCNHMITATVFNVSSDLMMLLIPIPLLINAQLPLKRKLVLCCVFGLGIFVILAAVLNRYYNFSEPFSPIFLNWYVGETATAVYVANIPLCWPLLRRIFSLDAFSAKRSGQFPSGFNLPGAAKNMYSNKNSMRVGAGRLPSSDDMSTEFMQNESEERITGGSRAGWPLEEPRIELSPLDGKTSYMATVGVGKDEESSDVKFDHSRLNNGRTITKTVQVTQYSL